MIRQYKTTLIIWASLLISELHSFWENSTEKANWILKENVVMSVQWNIKNLTDEVWFIMMALAILVYEKNRINRTTVLAYTAFCCIDMIMYFYNYKQAGYEAIYTFLLIAWILIYNHGGRSTTTIRPGITFETQRQR